MDEIAVSKFKATCLAVIEPVRKTRTPSAAAICGLVTGLIVSHKYGTWFHEDYARNP